MHNLTTTHRQNEAPRDAFAVDPFAAAVSHGWRKNTPRQTHRPPVEDGPAQTMTAEAAYRRGAHQVAHFIMLAIEAGASDEQLLRYVKRVERWRDDLHNGGNTQSAPPLPDVLIEREGA